MFPKPGFKLSLYFPRWWRDLWKDADRVILTSVTSVVFSFFFFFQHVQFHLEGGEKRTRAVWDFKCGWVDRRDKVFGRWAADVKWGWKWSHLIQPLHHYPILFYATYDSSHYITFMGSPGLPEAGSVEFQSMGAWLPVPSPLWRPPHCVAHLLGSGDQFKETGEGK